jgi:AraC-like DNA-binding protein
MNQSEATYPKFYLYNRIVKAKLFIDNNFQDNLDLDNIADEAYFSKFHFIRLFKSIYGKTPHQYLTQVRIEKAKHFLRLDHTVSDTCFKVGFDSITSFTGLFKKSEGKTPSAYQRQHRIRQENIKANPLHFIPNCFAEQKGWIENSNFQEVL